MKKKYGRSVSIFDPGHIGVMLVSSEDENIGVQDLINEFQIELLDDYLARALAHHRNPENIEP